MSPSKRFVNVTIPTAADGLSPAVDLGEESLAAIQMPAAWTAAALTFQVSADGVTYQSMYDSGNAEVTIASAGVVASRFITFVATLVDAFRAVRYLKVRSGVAATPVQQAAARTLQLQLKQRL